ncbi:MAG: hypothetical protein ACTS8Z_06165 [Candidatus Limnocylindrales bacterium]
MNQDAELESARDVDAERVALIWVDGEQAIIAHWQTEPTIERIASGVPPKRPAVGSVRRGPARPSGGGRVPGHGTEGRHLDGMRRYLADLVARATEFEVVEIVGRGPAPEQLAASMRRLAAARNEPLDVAVRRVARRPTERQMLARLRVLADKELPRRSSGPYGGDEPQATAASGKALPPPPIGGRARRRLPERREIELEVELMLADDPTD